MSAQLFTVCSESVSIYKNAYRYQYIYIYTLYLVGIDTKIITEGSYPRIFSGCSLLSSDSYVGTIESTPHLTYKTYINPTSWNTAVLGIVTVSPTLDKVK